MQARNIGKQLPFHGNLSTLGHRTKIDVGGFVFPRHLSTKLGIKKPRFQLLIRAVFSDVYIEAHNISVEFL